MSARRPLVSILTPTWQRRELLMGCIANVRAQTYPSLEHVVVSDGPDDELAEVMIDEMERALRDRRLPLRFAELGRNWSTFLPDAYCWAPVTVATLMATGEYHAWLADDERMDPDHVEVLVDAISAAGADFAYSKVRMWKKGSAESSYVIGSDPPRHGQITHCLYRADLLKRGLYYHGDDRASDWKTIERWIAAGATWAYVDRETMTHRVDR